MNNTIFDQELWGISNPRLRPLSPPNENHLLHEDVLPQFLQLEQAARLEGIELKVASSYRGFHRQLLIWNEKVQGKRTLWDWTGTHELRPYDLSEKELVFTILRWSALPGMGRHHWGTDFDVYDGIGLQEFRDRENLPDYQLQLVPAEYAPQGPFAHLASWLTQKIKRDEAFGFYWPYDQDRDGISPEKWHLSYHPLASEYFQRLSLPDFAQFLQAAPEEFLLKDVVLANLDEIFERFIKNVNLK